MTQTKENYFVLKPFYPSHILIASNLSNVQHLTPFKFKNFEYGEFPILSVKYSQNIDMKGINYSKRSGFCYGGLDNRTVWFRYPFGPIDFCSSVEFSTESTLKFLVNSPYWRFPFKIGALDRARDQLFDIITVRLLKLAKVACLHCSALSNGQESALIMAPSETGKTLTALLGVKRGYKIMAEDLLTSDGQFLFPDLTLESAGIYSGAYLNSNNPSLSFWIKNKILDAAGFESFKGYILPKSGLLPFSTIEKKPIPLKYLFFLGRGPEDVKLLDKEHSIKKVLNLHRQEFHAFNNSLLRTYEYFGDVSLDLEKMADVELEILQRVVENAKCYSVNAMTPFRFIDLVCEKFTPQRNSL